jgi:hypothetical protein
VAAVALVPAVAWFYSSSAGSVGGVGQGAALAALSLMGAVTLATFLRPVGGLARAAMSPCAAAAPLQMVLAALFLHLGADPLRWVTALVIAGVALAQRTTGSSTCSVSPWGGGSRT